MTSNSKQSMNTRKVCDNCGGPLPLHPHLGRPWADQTTPAQYCCYGCLALGEETRLQKAVKTNYSPRLTSFPPSLVLRLGVTIIITAQIMIFSLAINLHDDVPLSARYFVERMIIFGTVVTIVLLGKPLLLTAWQELVTRKIGIDFLFAITLIGSFIASLHAYINEHGYIYFETCPIILISYNLGKMLIAHVRTTVINNCNHWKHQIATARKRLPDGTTSVVSIEEVRKGDHIQVNPGEMIPVDGRLIYGSCFISTAFINGEPFPTSREKDDFVYAGEIVYDSSVIIESTIDSGHRKIDKMIHKTEIIADSIIRLNRLIDKLSKIFILLIVSVAICTFTYWYMYKHVSLGQSLYYTMSILLVSCPCTIGLVIPLITWTTVNTLVSNGLIIRSSSIIEKLAEIDLVAFDKTGTLTNIDNHTFEFITPLQYSELDFLKYQLKIIEENSNHPIAKSLIGIIDTNLKYELPILTEIDHVPGKGIIAQIIHSNILYNFHIGTYKWIKTVAQKNSMKNIYRYINANNSLRTIFICRNYEIIAVLSFRETLIDSFDTTICNLNKIGITTYVLTGDTATINTDAIGQKNVLTELSPCQKQIIIQALADKGHKVLFIGDGINDITAMNSAYCSITLSHATDLNIQISDAVIYRNDLTLIPWAIIICRNAIDNIHNCIKFSIIYNAIGIGLAASGYLHPVIAILLMVLSSIWLISSAIRITSNTNHISGNKNQNNCTYISNSLRDKVTAAIYIFLIYLQILILDYLYDNELYLGWILGLPTSILAVYVWTKIKDKSHYFNMVFNMVAAGNTGMLIGHLLELYHAQHYHLCTTNLLDHQNQVYHFIYMYLGMLIFSSIPSIVNGYYCNFTILHKVNYYVYNNTGMVLGMLLSMYICRQTNSTNFIINCLIMNIGMITGMLSSMYLFNKIGEISKSNIHY